MSATNADDSSSEWYDEILGQRTLPVGDRGLPSVLDPEDESDVWLRELLSGPAQQQAASSAASSSGFGGKQTPAPGVRPVVVAASSGSGRAQQQTASSAASSGGSGKSASASFGSGRARSRSPRSRAVGVQIGRPEVPPRWEFRSVQTLLDAFPGVPLVVPGHGEIVADFLDPARTLERAAPEILARLSRWMETFGRILVFKIGISRDPEHRWSNEKYGYLRERIWHAMDLVFIGEAEACRKLEQALIAAAGKIPGCHNMKPGGEGVKTGSKDLCWCYLVVAGAGSSPLFRLGKHMWHSESCCRSQITSGSDLWGGAPRSKCSRLLGVRDWSNGSCLGGGGVYLVVAGAGVRLPWGRCGPRRGSSCEAGGQG